MNKKSILLKKKDKQKKENKWLRIAWESNKKSNRFYTASSLRETIRYTTVWPILWL